MDHSSFTYEHYGILVQSEDDEIAKPNQLCGINVHNITDGEFLHTYIFMYIHLNACLLRTVFPLTKLKFKKVYIQMRSL